MSDGYLWKEVCVWKQQKGQSGRECIRWIEPGLALTFWELTFWEVDILGVDFLGVDILGVDILGVDILGRTPPVDKL